MKNIFIFAIQIMDAETLLAGYPIFQFHLFLSYLFGTDPRRKKFEEACVENPHEEPCDENPHKKKFEEVCDESPHEEPCVENPHEEPCGENPHKKKFGEACDENPHEEPCGENPHKKKFEEACEAFLATNVRGSVVISKVRGLIGAFEPVKTALWEKMWEEDFTARGFTGSKFYRESVDFSPFREIICEGINGFDLFPAFRGFLEKLHEIKQGIITK